MGTSKCLTLRRPSGLRLLLPKPYFLSNMLRKEKAGEMSQIVWQVYSLTVTRTIEHLDRYFSRAGLAQLDASLQDSELPSVLHLTTVSLVVRSKTPLTDQEALWIAFNRLPKHFDVGEG